MWNSGAPGTLESHLLARVSACVGMQSPSVPTASIRPWCSNGSKKAEAVPTDPRVASTRCCLEEPGPVQVSAAAREPPFHSTGEPGRGYHLPLLSSSRWRGIPVLEVLLQGGKNLGWPGLRDRMERMRMNEWERVHPTWQREVTPRLKCQPGHLIPSKQSAMYIIWTQKYIYLKIRTLKQVHVARDLRPPDINLSLIWQRGSMFLSFIKSSLNFIVLTIIMRICF